MSLCLSSVQSDLSNIDLLIAGEPIHVWTGD